MDLGDSFGGSDGQPDEKPRPLPADLPTSLDDRRHVPNEHLITETEMYDGWQGLSHTCASCITQHVADGAVKQASPSSSPHQL